MAVAPAQPEATRPQLTPEETRRLALEWGLSESEYDSILERLGRVPTVTEIAMFSVEWCEHCGYPKSRKLLALFPKESRRVKVLVGADTGGFHFTDELAVVMKVESHNHPSQVEPFQGAATGVGGILRDIFTVGARPIASANSLRFGNLDDPYTRYLLNGVVRGIGHYGNCVGVPTVAGEVYFHPSYTGNCLVNALSVGVGPLKKLVSSSAAGPGNPVVYVGSSTGRDGIGGCSVLASHEFGEGEEKRPTVQIGDPFTEKCLIEACLEAIDTGAVVAMKDMGAAGVTCTTSEMAAAGGVGMRVELQRIPRREAGMEPYEVMMSESQERMLLVAERGREEELLAVFRKWDLQAVVIGEVTDDGMLTILDGGEVVAHVSAELLTTPPKYDMPAEEPEYLAETRAFDPASLTTTAEPGEALLRLMGSPNLCSRRWIWEQYDHMVQTNTVVAPGADAAVLRIKEAAPKGIALTIDGNSRWVYLDPYEGARLAVAEAARNLACVGAEPAIVTDGLNFANPDKPDRYWQFRRAVEGIADACRALDVAVVSGNVSFYNESPEGPIHPTPIIGMLGTLADVTRHATPSFKGEGDLIYRVGPDAVTLGGSEYLAVIHGREAGQPVPVDLKLESRVQNVVRALVRDGLLQSAHDCSDGGLAVALAECCIGGRIGARVEELVSGQWSVVSEDQPEGTPAGLPTDHCALPTALFGEGPSRIVISVRREDRTMVEARLASAGVPGEWLGTVGGPTLVIGDALNVAVSALEETWETTLPNTMAPGRQQPSDAGRQ
jgi:phosphoribosylformylglycinamidine synthase subunit PurL